MCLLDGGIDGFIAADLPVNEEVKAAIKGYSVDIVSFVEQIFSLPSYQVMLTNLVKDFDSTTTNDEFSVQFRIKLREYFFYAISGKTNNASDPGVCDSGCSEWADKCCANI
jgi:hypothetical protein